MPALTSLYAEAYTVSGEGNVDEVGNEDFLLVIRSVSDFNLVIQASKIFSPLPLLAFRSASELSLKQTVISS